MKQQLDVIVVDLKSDVLCSFSAEINVSFSCFSNSTFVIYIVVETDGWERVRLFLCGTCYLREARNKTVLAFYIPSPLIIIIDTVIVTRNTS